MIWIGAKRTGGTVRARGRLLAQYGAQYGAPGAARRLAIAIFAIGMSLSTPAKADQVSVVIEGIDAELADAARASIQLTQYEGRDVTPAQIRRLFAQAENEIDAALRPFGYYNATVDADLRGDNGEFRAVFIVNPGEPVRVTDKRVQVLGPAADDEEIQAAQSAFELSVGERMDDALYEDGKARIDAALRARGYLTAELLTHRVAVTQSANSAEIDLVWQSGPRFRFGAVRFSESQFEADFLERYVPWQANAHYSEELLVELQEGLVSADYFSVVSVRPDLEDARDGIVPIEVMVVPAKRDVYAGDLHYSTDSGVGVGLSFDRRWLNRRGHKIHADVEYSQRVEGASTVYTLPLPGPNRLRYSFGVAYRDLETRSSRSRDFELAAARSDRWHGFMRTLGLKFIKGDFDIGMTQTRSDMLYFEGSLSRKRADDMLFPRDGSATTVTLRVAPEAAFTDSSLVQARIDEKWVHGFTERNRLILRASIGALTASNFDRLPPVLRFFAGGDRSIRGFGHQEIGELNADGVVIGGKYLAVASTEVEHYFLPNWGLALFTDAGDAFSHSFDVNVGAGVGLRWRSPIGPVRLDVARVLVSDLEHGWRVHIGIGPDL